MDYLFECTLFDSCNISCDFKDEIIGASICNNEGRVDVGTDDIKVKECPYAKMYKVIEVEPEIKTVED